MTHTTHKSIIKQVEKWAPKSLAYDWDNVGLQIGNLEDKTKKTMITLDVLDAVVDEAIENGVNLIIAHHPLLFQPLKQIDFTSTKGKVIKKLIQHDITVYAAHTNLDIAVGGVNDLLINKLAIENSQPFITTHQEALFKLTVFVPLSHVENVRNALSEAGAGHIGNYSHCTFQSKGNGTFMPLEGTNPFIGSTDKLEIVDEMKIETIVSEQDLSKVIAAMKRAHPYEEAAYDVYVLKNEGKTHGLGRVGTLETTEKLSVVANNVKNAYQLDTIRVTGDLDQPIKKIAVIGGSGQRYIQQAKRQGVDALITGDVTFHVAQDAQEMGLAVIDAGHYIEKIMKQATKNYLTESFTDIEIIVSQTNTDPFKFI